MVGLKLAVLVVTLFYMVQNIFLNQVPIIETKKVEAKKLIRSTPTTTWNRESYFKTVVSKSCRKVYPW